jgi:hypothetical protein
VLLAAACGASTAQTNAEQPDRSQSTEAPAKTGVTGSFEFPDSVVAGEIVNGTLVIENNTGSTVKATSGCDKWQAILERDAISTQRGITLEACPPPDRVLPVGVTRLAFAVPVSAAICPQPDTEGREIWIECSDTDWRDDPLPAGEYQLRADSNPFGWPIEIAPFTVDVEARVASRIEIGTHTVRGGENLSGTLIVENNTGRAIVGSSCLPEAAMGLMNEHASTEIMLKEDCPVNSPERILEPGTNRFDFSVRAVARQCMGSMQEDDSSTGRSKCAIASEEVALPPGEYLLRLSESAWDEVTPQPLTVQVTP